MLLHLNKFSVEKVNKILNKQVEIKMPQFSNEMLEAIEEAEEIEKHPEDYKSFSSVEEFMEDLHSEIQNRKN